MKLKVKTIGKAFFFLSFSYNSRIIKKKNDKSVKTIDFPLTLYCTDEIELYRIIIVRYVFFLEKNMFSQNRNDRDDT